MQDSCSVFIVFARIEMKTSLVLSLKTLMRTEFHGRRRTQIRIRASSTRQVSLTKLRFLLKTCCLKEGMVLKS
jgi:hypothetical protein